MPDATVVVPCYNEAERLDTSAFRRFASAHTDVGFLFVDDGSTDRTRAILDRLRLEGGDGFHALHLPRNVGKAEAVRLGMLRAFDDGAAVAGFWDADLATPLDAIPAFRAVLRERPELEAVLGSRVRLLGREVRRSPRRHYLGRVFASSASLLIGLPVYDTQCGAKMFRVSPTTRSLFREPFRSRWLFDVEILARLIRARPGVAERLLFELPLDRWHDVDGSKLKARDFVRAPLELLQIRRHYRAGRRADAAAAGAASGPHLDLRGPAVPPRTSPRATADE